MQYNNFDFTDIITYKIKNACSPDNISHFYQISFGNTFLYIKRNRYHDNFEVVGLCPALKPISYYRKESVYYCNKNANECVLWLKNILKTLFFMENKGLISFKPSQNI